MYDLCSWSKVTTYYEQLLELSDASSFLDHFSTFETTKQRSEELKNIFSDNEKTKSTLDIASHFISNCKPLKNFKKDISDPFIEIINKI